MVVMRCERNVRPAQAGIGATQQREDVAGRIRNLFWRVTNAAFYSSVAGAWRDARGIATEQRRRRLVGDERGWRSGGVERGVDRESPVLDGSALVGCHEVQADDRDQRRAAKPWIPDCGPA